MSDDTIVEEAAAPVVDKRREYNRNRKNTHRALSLYNAELGKSKTIYLKRSDFDSPEELEKVCERMKRENREKNAEYRRNQRRGALALGIQKYNEAGPDVLKAALAEEIGKTIHLPTIKSRISLDLDRKTGNTMVLFGSSKRGKSTLMMHLYRKYFRNKELINTLFSGNPHLKVYKGDARLLVSYGFTTEHARYIQMQQYLNVKTKNQYTFTNLFDDIIDAKHAPVVNKMMMTYRNANISMMIALQYVRLLSKENRANVNHTFVFGMNQAEDERQVVEIILRPYFIAMGIGARPGETTTGSARKNTSSYDEMVKFYRAVTADHGFIYIDNINSRISFHRLDLKKGKK